MVEKTLEELEGVIWEESCYGSYLATTCHNLRKKPIDEFSVEDLRIMIGQNIGLNHLMPIAIEILETNPLASGDFYPGDLLMSAIDVENEFLLSNRDLTSRIIAVVESAISSTESTDDELMTKLKSFIESWNR